MPEGLRRAPPKLDMVNPNPGFELIMKGDSQWET
jgi:hypothetical protein